MHRSKLVAVHFITIQHHFQKTFTDDNFARHINYGDEQQYLIEDNHQAIISRVDFENVAVLMRQRGMEKGNNGADIKYQNRYTFTGKIICGECGGKFKRKICTKNKYIAWGCTTHINTNSKDCKMLAIKEQSIKPAFVNMMNRIYADKILQPYIKDLKLLDGRYTEIANIEKQLQSILEQVKVLTGFMSNGYLDTALFNVKNNALQAEMAQLKERKASIDASSKYDVNRVAEAEKLLKYLANTTDYSYSDDVFDKFVSSITVFSPTEIGFNLKNGLCLKEGIVR